MNRPGSSAPVRNDRGCDRSGRQARSAGAPSRAVTGEPVRGLPRSRVAGRLEHSLRHRQASRPRPSSSRWSHASAGMPARWTERASDARSPIRYRPRPQARGWVRTQRRGLRWRTGIRCSARRAWWLGQTTRGSRPGPCRPSRPASRTRTGLARAGSALSACGWWPPRCSTGCDLRRDSAQRGRTEVARCVPSVRRVCSEAATVFLHKELEGGTSVRASPMPP
jgi:hypothetical protein